MKQMPIFDEWGPRPAGLQGPRENPVVVTALPVGQGDSSSSGGAGRHEAPEAEGAPGRVTAPAMLMREQLLGPVPLRLRVTSSCPQRLRLRPLRLQLLLLARQLAACIRQAPLTQIALALRLRCRLIPVPNSWAASAWTLRPSGREGRPWATITLVAC